MKRTKLLALTLVVAIMLVGAGYAAWTDTLVHNVAVNTGEFDLTFTRKYANPSVTYATASMNALEDNFTADPSTYGPNNKTVNFKFNNAYPGTSMQTSTTVTNNGTIPAVIDSVVIGLDITDENSNIIANSELLDAMIVDYVYYIMKDGQTVSQARRTISGSTTLGNLETELKNELEGEYLLPGEELTNGAEEESAYKLVFKIPAGNLNGDEAENEIVDLSITYNFVQHNVY